MPRTSIAAQDVIGPSQNDGLVVTLAAADTVNLNETPFTGREILIAYNSGATPRTVTITGITDPFGAIRHITAAALAAGAIKIFGPFDQQSWMQTARTLYFQGSHAEVKFSVLRLPIPAFVPPGALDAGSQTAGGGGVRTKIQPQILAGSLATDGITLALFAADVVNNNRIPLTDRDLLFAFNSHATDPFTATVTSVADNHGRLGHITADSIAAGVLVVYGPFDYAWMQTDRHLYFLASDVAIKFGAVRY